MTNNTVFIVLMAIVTSLVIGMLLLKHARARKQTREEPLPQEIRDQTHDIKGDAMIVRSEIAKLAKKKEQTGKDPIAALIKAIHHKEAS